jgi:hypothetical protein
MTPRLRKFGLTAHIVSSVGWLGAVAAFLATALAGLNGQDPQMMRASYLTMNVTGWFVIVPLSFASPLTGVLQALGTTWGLFRHYWVLIKFLITIPATLLLLLHMQPVGHLARVVAETTSTRGEFAGLRIQLLADAVAAVVVLLIATTLSIYKPWGVTDYGRRVLQLPRTGGPSDTHKSQVISNTPWGRYVLLAIGGLVLIVILVHLMGGGLGGH